MGHTCQVQSLGWEEALESHKDGAPEGVGERGGDCHSAHDVFLILCKQKVLLLKLKAIFNINNLGKDRRVFFLLLWFLKLV